MFCPRNACPLSLECLTLQACQVCCSSTHLVNGLVGPSVPQLKGSVCCQQQQGDVGLAGLYNRRQQVGNSSAAAADHRSRPACMGSSSSAGSSKGAPPAAAATQQGDNGPKSSSVDQCCPDLTCWVGASVAQCPDPQLSARLCPLINVEPCKALGPWQVCFKQVVNHLLVWRIHGPEPISISKPVGVAPNTQTQLTISLGTCRSPAGLARP
jgi:hypothetical protein